MTLIDKWLRKKLMDVEVALKVQVNKSERTEAMFLKRRVLYGTQHKIH